MPVSNRSILSVGLKERQQKMKLIYAAVAALFMMATLSPPCYADQKSDAVKALPKAYPKFKWQSDNIVTLDINADGFKDIVVLGYAEKTAAVGVILGSSKNAKQTKILEFARGGQEQRGMCGKTAKLLIEKQSEAPQEAVDEFPEGYRICKNCYEIAVDDGICDPIHIYWNHKTKELDWWRA
jgi:hypothetical protein